VTATTDTIQQIWVAAGTYYPLYAADGASTDPRDKAFVLVQGVKIYGGFAGTETDIAQRQFPSYGGAGVVNTTILSGDIGTAGNNTDNCYHVIIGADNITAATILDGFTITGGNANGSDIISVNGQNIYRFYGGGIHNYWNSSPTLTNVTISGNSATSGGGIYSIYTASTQIYNSIIWGNSGTNIHNDGNSTTTYQYSLVEGVGSLNASFNIGLDPLFEDWKNPSSATMPNTAGDYTLKAGSPAIGAGNKDDYPGGTTALASATDLAGNPRLFGTNIDMGAYEAEVYLATFQFGSPRPDSIVHVVPNGNLIKPADPDSTGYTFGEWYADALYTTLFNFTGNITQDTTLYAKWRATVSFNPNGGDVMTPGDTIVDLGTKISGWTHVPTRTGCTFDGWYTDNVTFADEWDIDNDHVTRDTTLYARWLAEVTFDPNGGYIAENDTIVDCNRTVSGWAHVPERAGLAFDGWYTDDGTFADEWDINSDLVTQDTTLYSKWIAKVTFDPNGGVATSPADTTVNYGRNIGGWAHVPTLAGCTFGGWYTDGIAFTGEWNIATTPVTQDTTLYAKWRATVSFDPTGGSIAEDDTIVDLNQTVSGWVHVPSLAGFTFGGWYTDDGVFNDEWILASSPVTQDTALYARWRAKVTFDPNGDAVTPGDTVVDIGRDVDGWAHFPSRTGYTFVDWYTGTALTIPFSPTGAISGDSTVYAKWDIITHTVTFEREPGVVYKTQQALHGDCATLPVPAPDSMGCRFDGWYTDDAYTAAWVFAATPVMQDITLYAKWTRLPQQITVTDPRYTGGLNDIVITTPPSDYTKVSDTEYEVLFSDEFSFRLEYDYPYTDAATTVTVNGERIYPDEYGIYTVKIKGTTAIGIVPGIGIAPPDITRHVDILHTEDVTTAVYQDGALRPGPGRFYVKGHGDLVFIAGYNGNPPLKVTANGYYSNGDIEIIGHDLEDGTYRYVLKQVVEPWTITFGPDFASRTTGNEVIGDANVHAYGNTLYITSSTGGNARIYNVTGVLVKIQTCIAGETAKTALAKGLYFVVIGGTSRKIVISE
ncbi:MAG: InlB B-repeat-containing protein, partial [Tannerella sp.]|nr:InlB B-repeat-containing protein [Tannerella sp.]